MVNEEIEKIENWIYFNKLTLNYSKCCFMIISRKPLDTSEFSLTTNSLNIKRSDCVKFIDVLFNEHLSWKNQEQKLNKSLSKMCGLTFKLRHYVPLTTRKLIYYSMFHSVTLYSLINWGRTTNLCLHQLEVLQNKFIRPSLFLPRNSPIDCSNDKFQTIKLKDLIKFEFAKFIFRFKNKCFLYCLTITLSNSIKCTNIAQHKNQLTVIIIMHSTVSLVEKDYITHV